MADNDLDKPNAEAAIPTIEEFHALLNAEPDPLSDALSELASLIKPLTGEQKTAEYLYYLLLLWAYLAIYQLEPFITDSDEGDGAPKITQLENGWKIFDYGYCLLTSPGENFGTYCTGKLIETIKEMFKILSQRGAKRINFAGHPIAERIAWIESQEHDIDCSFYASEIDRARYHQIQKIRQEMQKRAITQEKRPG